MKYRKLSAWVIVAILGLSMFLPFLVPEVNADSKASRTTISKAGQIVTCYDDGTFLDDRGLATLGSSFRNIRTGLKFEGFNNISKSSRIDSATLRIYYYTGIDFGTTTEAQLLIEAIKDGAPEFLTWDGVVNGWDSDHITWFNMSWLNASGYYDITLNPDMIQELVLSSPWLHDDTPENGSIVLRTWNVAPVGPGFQPYHYEIPTGEPSLSNLRPTLTITYTPGVYDDGYVVTPGGPGSSGIAQYQALIYDTGTNNHYIRAGNVSEPWTVFNESEIKHDLSQLKSQIEQVGNLTYLLGPNGTDQQDLRIWSSPDGINWTSLAQVEGNATNKGYYGFAWDQTRQCFHVAYDYGFDVRYTRVYLNGTVDPVTKGFEIVDGGNNVQLAVFVWVSPLDNKTWFTAGGGTPASSTRQTKVKSLTQAGVWSDTWEDAGDTRSAIITTVGSELILCNYWFNSHTIKSWRFIGNDTVLSWNLTSNGLAWPAQPSSWDAIGGYDNTSDRVLIQFAVASNKPSFRESKNYGATWSAITQAPGPNTVGPFRIARTPAHNITFVYLNDTYSRLAWGDYEDFFYHRDLIGDYAIDPALFTNMIYMGIKREMGVSGAGAVTNATWIPFEPDPPIPGFNETCIDRQLRINFGAGPYTEDQVQDAIDYCEDWIPGNETIPDDLTYAISKKSFKLYYLVIGTASIVIPWLLYAFSSDPEYIGWILILNALGIGLLIEFMRL